MTGIVKFFNRAKGYGLITPLIGKPATTENIFFHASAIIRREDGLQQAIPSGAEVRFDVVRAADGRVQAANVEAVVVRLNGERRRR